MGNATSSRRIQTNPDFLQSPEYGSPQSTSHGHTPQYYGHTYVPPELRSQPYPQTYMSNNGQYAMNMPSGAFNPGITQGAGIPSNLTRPPIAEQKVTAIRNEVNVNKATIHLLKDEKNPDFYLVAFTFDAIVSGSICILFHAKEGPDFSLIGMKPDLIQPVRVPFEKGLHQKFVQPSGTGVKLSEFDPSDLLNVKDEIYPLMLRLEANEDSSGVGNVKTAGAPLSKHVGAQTTSCMLEMKDDEYSVKVIKQIIWVKGIRYELQEIYGIESVEGGEGINANDFGKECVICLSEPRNTTVLPCRHMCLCSECAKLLQLQTNRCPICRTPVHKLLEIEIPEVEGASDE